jgi:hypothetical protein
LTPFGQEKPSAPQETKIFLILEGLYAHRFHLLNAGGRSALHALLEPQNSGTHKPEAKEVVPDRRIAVEPLRGTQVPTVVEPTAAA